ncbi:MAG: hypothetical protein EPN69_11825 [Rhodanobacter sp.]|nr:MAG: hypothetical protein EPN71_15940 [Rhodanobacter sp.]TAL90700.1 MAG: hypothetical protein EPN69_11825 [Rhodanobacter sp.]TAM42080.1 MAG: hypothetical protein EPN58_04270 [Rhodanobacter sp.]
MHPHNALHLAVGHLNVPVGDILTAGQLALAMQQGSLESLAESPSAAALVSSLFIDLPPGMILQAGAEAKADIKQLDKLYAATLAASMPRARAWEKTIEHML